MILLAPAGKIAAEQCRRSSKLQQVACHRSKLQAADLKP